ncbi:hypothetical protein [Candidatus Pelagadaptatus aseana]|uniref:hypothetical protein n=1 Tax=Candidatus Pelagadaptatus aseana TaxID=3120508 RepID=UPI003C704F67
MEGIDVAEPDDVVGAADPEGLLLPEGLLDELLLELDELLEDCSLQAISDRAIKAARIRRMLSGNLCVLCLSFYSVCR